MKLEKIIAIGVLSGVLLTGCTLGPSIEETKNYSFPCKGCMPSEDYREKTVEVPHYHEVHEKK